MNTYLEYYAESDKLTDLSNYKDFTDWLSLEPRVIFQVAQGLIIHDSWVERYGIEKLPKQNRNVCTLSASDIIKQANGLREISISPSIPRSPEERVMACCREYALLATALFRANGIPARARCGFALYLASDNYYEDHWICEYWNGKSWTSIDPQIDPFQQSFLSNYANTEKDISPEYKEMLLTLNPLDVSSNHFINAGAAWKMYRAGEVDAGKFGIGADPKDYGIETLYGAWFIRGQLLRDFAALNKVEAVPFLVRLEFGQDWKSWRLVSAKDDELSDGDLKLLDEIADLCIEPDANREKIKELFESNQNLHPLL